ncbi:hypothetical protein WN55_03867 [Dufourea novaeangliae]|uniref:Uncharacterized protein n=1 Tax=Dufourea novaeangliae TaxID=178035 RepID=A0A154NWZ5_DUFNO|nr:hypothetical protein WN55_03867 [Dufourea novaeangliae]
MAEKRKMGKKEEANNGCVYFERSRFPVSIVNTSGDKMAATRGVRYQITINKVVFSGCRRVTTGRA